MQAHTFQAEIEVGAAGIHCRGPWIVAELGAVARELDRLQPGGSAPVVVDAAGVAALDTTGAWLLRRLQRRLEQAGREVRIEGLSAPFADLLAQVTELGGVELARTERLGRFAELGHRVAEGLEQVYTFFGFFGEVVLRMGALALTPWRVRWNAVWTDLYAAGATALGIVGLLSFLMGVVFAYQGAVQLSSFGANIYIADLVGLVMTRELGPLLAAIIVAGRTGSAYTAQIGTMKVTEEVSALRTIGVDPLDLLVIPKVLSLCIALPLLSVFADIMGVAGGMVLSKAHIGLSFTVFLDRIQEAVSVRSFLIGIGKAPVFALIIALIGCFQGFQVKGSAASVGQHTTISVVQSIFLVIVADALFSVVFSWLGI
ncbi:MAG: ABC transporter permease [Thiohalobacteraceae bacterium]